MKALPTRHALVVALFGLVSACATFDAPHPQRKPKQGHSTGPLGVGEQGTAAQALIGAALFDDLEFERSDSGATGTVDLSEMPLLGIAGQMPFTGDDDLEIGFEAGIMFSWWSDDAEVIAAGNGQLLVRIDRQLMLWDIFAGAFVSTMLGPRVRAYAGLGPLMMIGYLDYDDDDRSGSETSFDIGGYVRGGLEYRLDDGSFLGLGVRGLSSSADFDEIPDGDVDLDGVEVMLTFTKAF